MKCSCTSNARTHLMLVLLEDESRIVPTEAERVRNGHIHVVLERFVADDDVRIHFRIQIADVTVRVQDTRLDSLHHGHRLDGAGGTQKMANHRLGAIHLESRRKQHVRSRIS